MTNTPAKDRVESLDPDDWDALAQLGHRMVDDMIEQLRTVRERPAWQPLPAHVKSVFREQLPAQPQHAEQVYHDFDRYVRPYLRGNLHPRFWAWVEGAGTPFAALAEMLAASLNCNVSFGEQAPVYVELQVLDWCKQMFGYPAEASGLLVSGGSEAGLIALTVARNAKASVDVAQDGLAAAYERLVAYGSTETHSSIQKALEIIGLGSNALRKIPVGPDFRIDVQALELAIQADRLTGKTPFCVIGNAGTVNTGAIDDLAALAKLARDEDLWFHVDGAFGSMAALAPRMRHLVNGMTEADSLAFDLHKWMSVPYEAGIAIPSSTVLHGKYAIRVAVTNHRSQDQDFEQLIEAVLNYGYVLLDELSDKRSKNSLARVWIEP